jgi:transcriptional regulator with XRE-family HTH domain
MAAGLAVNPQLITERRIAAGLTIRQLAERLGIDAWTLEQLERGIGRGGERVSVAELTRICAALDLDPAQVIGMPVTGSAAPAAADDRKVEAALIEHGAVVTRDDLAAALGWPLARLERALLALERRLKPTGLRLRRAGWNSYTLGPNLDVLTGEERRRLNRIHAGRAGLTDSVAFILLAVVTGYRTEDWLLRLPPDDRRGIELLARQELIERDKRDRWVPSTDVIDSLQLSERRFLEQSGSDADDADEVDV